jgi:hypothetical protein
VSANDRQVGGEHYKTGGLEHWDVVLMFGLGYFEGQITKYLFRWQRKNGLEDLKKARHYLDKLIESEEKPMPDKPPEVTVHYAADWLQHVKPTGWVMFEFEGVDADGWHYRCQRCRQPVRGLKQFQPPWDKHDARTCPARGSLQQPEQSAPPEGSPQSGE